MNDAAQAHDDQAMPGVVLTSTLRKQLTSLCACASADDARPVLACVAFQGTTAAATDSYILGMLDLGAGGSDEQRLVAAKPLSEALRRASKTDDVRIVFDQDAATVIVDGPTLIGTRSHQTRLPYVEGKFPDFATLIPKFDGCGPDAPAFNPRNVAKIAALAPPDLLHAPPVRLRWQDALKPIRVEVAHGNQLLGIVMPVRMS